MSRSREAISRQLRPEFLVKDLGGLLLYYPGREVAQRVPRAWLRAAARAGGAIVGRLGVEDMRAELRAIHRDRPMPRDEEAILRDAVELAMFNELEVLRYPSLDARSIDETCRVEGREHLDAALAQGKGAIVLIGHLGANQVVMPALGHRGYRMSQLSAPPPAWRRSSATPARRRRGSACSRAGGSWSSACRSPTSTSSASCARPSNACAATRCSAWPSTAAAAMRSSRSSCSADAPA